MAGLAVEPALAPGWGLSWFVRCSGLADPKGRANPPSQTTSPRLVTCSASSEEETWQKPHWPGSRSCLQRSALPLADLGAVDALIAAPLVFGCMTWNS